MLIRIVRMTFEEGKVDEFLKIFYQNKENIRHFRGCTHLDLLEDLHNKNVFSTYSIWEDDDALNEYRSSDLFKSVWAPTKALFSDKPQASSYKRNMTV
ncbi:MAG: antibiotic biosynthesis monooxygenase family protein [Bacteroidota bacterium]